MTSPASAQFPWSVVPEPPSGEFRSGQVPAVAGGGDYLAARGSRPGPALLVLAGHRAGFAAVHGLFRLVDVLDAHRLAGSLLVRLAGDGEDGDLAELLDPASVLIAFESLRLSWRELSTASYQAAGRTDADRLMAELAAGSGAQFRYTRALDETAGWMADRGRAGISLRTPDRVDERPEAIEHVFQGLINMLRVAGMLEGLLAPVESRGLQPPAYAEAPVSGYWSPVARPGQRMRIDDKLGSFRDARGNELGNLLTNISGILLGISTRVWVEAGEPVAEIARPLT